MITKKHRFYLANYTCKILCSIIESGGRALQTDLASSRINVSFTRPDVTTNANATAGSIVCSFVSEFATEVGYTNTCS